MLNVEFLLLNHNHERQRLLFTCQCAAKCYANKETIYLLTANQAQALQLDELLWTFDDTSFIPHIIHNPKLAPLDDKQINIHWEVPPEGDAPYSVINLTPQLLPTQTNLNHLIEIILKNDEDLAQARQHYKAYQNAGAQLHYQQLT